MLQYACTGTSWIEVSYAVFTSYQCGFFPNTNITCWLEAVNGAGNSSQLIKSAITDCDGRLAYSKKLALLFKICSLQFIGFALSVAN